LDLQLEKEFDYQFSWNGNLDDDNPAIAHCRVLTEPERERLFERKYESGDYKVVSHDYEIVSAAVKGFSNFRINGQEVKDGKTLVSMPRVAGLVDELAKEIIVRTMRPDLKN
jgi:hypothetical protein